MMTFLDTHGFLLNLKATLSLIHLKNKIVFLFTCTYALCYLLNDGYHQKLIIFDMMIFLDAHVFIKSESYTEPNSFEKQNGIFVYTCALYYPLNDGYHQKLIIFDKYASRTDLATTKLSHV